MAKGVNEEGGPARGKGGRSCDSEWWVEGVSNRLSMGWCCRAVSAALSAGCCADCGLARHCAVRVSIKGTSDS